MRERRDAGAHAKVPTMVGANGSESSRSVPLARTATDVQYQTAVRTLFPATAISDAVLGKYPSSDYATPWDAYVALMHGAQDAPRARLGRNTGSVSVSHHAFARRLGGAEAVRRGSGPRDRRRPARSAGFASGYRSSERHPHPMHRVACGVGGFQVFEVRPDSARLGALAFGSFARVGAGDRQHPVGPVSGRQVTCK